MKKCLPLAAYLCAVLLSPVHVLQAQIKGNPRLQSAAAYQPLTGKKSIHISYALQQLVDANNAARSMRTFSTEKPIPPIGAPDKIIVTKDNKVLVNITLKDDSRISKATLESLGLEITSTYGRIISGFVSIDAIAQFESLTGIRFVRPVYKLKSQLQIETAW